MKYEVGPDGKLHLLKKPKKVELPHPGLRPMQNAYEGPAFGGDKKSNHFSDLRGPIDLRGASDWVQIASYDTMEYKFGTINAEAMVLNATFEQDDETRYRYFRELHAEVQVLGFTAGNGSVITTSSVGHKMHLHDSISPGPFLHVIHEGSMPERVEIHARARRFGVPEFPGDTAIDTETFQLTTWVRFVR